MKTLGSSVVVRIRWRDGEPYIAIGDTYEVGKTKKQRRVNERGGKSGQPLNEWSQTISEALDREIQWWANYFCVFVERRGRKRAMEFSDMESAMCRLRRLRRKLEMRNVLT